MYHIIQTNNNFIACVQSVHHQHARSQTVAPMVNGSLDDVLSKINPILHQTFLQVTDVTNLCFIHALLHDTPNFYHSIQVHFDEAYTIHLMQFTLVISHCNITFPLFRHSHSVATLLRWGGWSSHRHMCRSLLNLTVKSTLKSVDFSRSYGQK